MLNVSTLLFSGTNTLQSSVHLDIWLSNQSAAKGLNCWNQYFCIFMCIRWILKLLVVFLLWKAYKTLPPCQNCRKCSASKAWQVLSTKITNLLTKLPHVATTGPSGMNTIIGALVYWDILGYTFGSAIQAWAILPPSWSPAAQWLYVANRISNWRSYLQHYRKDAMLLSDDM